MLLICFVLSNSHVTSEMWDWQGDDCGLEDNTSIGESIFHDVFIRKSCLLYHMEMRC